MKPRRRPTSPRRVIAALVAGGLAAMSLALAPTSNGITLAPAIDGATAVRSGQAVEIAGAVDASSSFISSAALIGYDEAGDEVVRQQITFGLNTPAAQSDGQEYLHVDGAGNVDGLLELECQFGDATSAPVDRFVAPCADQTETARDVQLAIVLGADEMRFSDLLRVDPIPPVVVGYEVVDPTTVIATFSEPIVHDTGTESASDFTFPGREAAVLGVAVGADDCAYAPGDDTRAGDSGCTRILTVSPPLPRDATPRIDYFPRGRDAHTDLAANPVYIRSIAPSRGEDADSLAADRVGPLPPEIEQVAGQAASAPGTGERRVLGNEPQPEVVVGSLEDGAPTTVLVDGVAAGSGTATGASAAITLDTPLADGVHELTSTSSDTAACDPEDAGAGTCANDSEPSETVVYDLDTVRPVIDGDALAGGDTIGVAFSERVTGADDAAQWTVDNGAGPTVTVTAVDDDRDDSVTGDAEASDRRTLTIAGGPLSPDATLSWTAPGTDPYVDAHGNQLVEFTTPLVIAPLPLIIVESVPGAETDRTPLDPAEPVTFDVSLSDAVPSGSTVTIRYETIAGTADGDDVAFQSGTITLTEGQQTADPIRLAVTGDAVDEFDESIVLRLFEASGARFAGDASHIAVFEQVGDDDPEAVAGFDRERYSVDEGDVATVTVELDTRSEKDIRIDWSTRYDLSADRADSSEQSGTVSVPAGSTSATFAVPTVDDLAVEGSELLEVVLSAPVNATLAGDADVAEISIVDNDVELPEISVLGRSADEDQLGDIPFLTPGTVAVEVELSQPSSRTVRVDYATGTVGTADEGDDFEATTGTLQFEPGDTVLLVEVPMVDDDLDEFDETVELVLSSPDMAVLAGGVVSLSGFATIVDDDELAAVGFADGSVDVAVDEGATATFTVELDTVSGKDVAVDWALDLDGDADGTDLPAAQSGTVTIPAGSPSASFDVTTTDDGASEPDESVSVVLSSPVNARPGAADEATLTIDDDDVVPTDPDAVLVSLSGAFVDEGTPPTPFSQPVPGETLDFVASLDRTTDEDVVLNFRTIPGTATAGEDFTARTGQVTIPAGEREVTIPVEVLADSIDEPDEDLRLQLTSASGNAEIPAGRLARTGTIVDDDAAPQLRLSDDTVVEGETAEVDVTLDRASVRDVTVTYAIREGTATPADYQDRTGTVTFPAGTTAAVIEVPTVADDVAETIEQATVVLSSPGNASIDDGEGTVSIVDLAGGVIAVFLDDITVAETDTDTIARIPVEMTAASDEATEVSWTSQQLTAAPGEDYVADGGTVTVPAGETSTVIEVVIVGDDAVEEAEDFLVVITEADEFVTGPTSRVTVTDDDQPGEAGGDSGGGGTDGGTDSGTDGGSGGGNGAVGSGGNGAVGGDGAGSDGSPGGGLELPRTGGGAAGLAMVVLAGLAARRRRD